MGDQVTAKQAPPSGGAVARKVAKSANESRVELQRGRGRPRIGPVVEVRLPPRALADIDKRAEQMGVPRADVLRWLVLVGLAHEPALNDE